MRHRNTILLAIILILFGFALWCILPIDSTRFNRTGFRFGLDLNGGTQLIYKADLSKVEEANQGSLMDGTIAIIQKRVNVLGVAEPTIFKQGNDRIVVQLPGIAETERAKEIIGLTNVLEFRELVEKQDGGSEWVPAKGKLTDGTEAVLTSKYFKTNTYITSEELKGSPFLIFEWDKDGTILSKEITTRLLNKPLGIYLGDQPLLGIDGDPIAPVVRSVIEQNGQIEGLSWTDARNLRDVLNAGRIPLPLETIFESSVDPTIGRDTVNNNLLAAITGLIMVLLFMIIYYRIPGFLACIALIFYGVIALAVFKLIPITLTLGGLAAFIVSIGMAVDANVLIAERTKEEIRTGKTIGAAVDAGFDRAWTAIRDSNISTFITCIVLFWFGGNPAAVSVRGFAITLFIGVAISMFTAIIVTRTFLKYTLGVAFIRKPGLFLPTGGKVRND